MDRSKDQAGGNGVKVGPANICIQSTEQGYGLGSVRKLLAFSSLVMIVVDYNILALPRVR